MLAGFLIYLKHFCQSLFQFSSNSASRTTVYRATLMVGLSLVLFPWMIFNAICLSLDPLFFRFNKIVPKSPLFIVGVPRSGTTFLHRLCALNQEFTTMPLWEILLAPSLLQKYFWWAVYQGDQFIGGPMFRLACWLEKIGFGALDDIHKTSLFEPEEDYLTLIPCAGCFLMIQAFPAAAEIWELAYFDRDVSPNRRQQIMDFYRGVVQRHLYFRGTERILLSKNPSFTPMMDSLKNTFPGCCIVACRRTPLETVASLLNSMASGSKLFGNSMRPEHFRDPYIRMLQHFYDQYESCPKLEIVEYQALTGDPRQIVQQIHHRFEFATDQQFDDNLLQATTAARAYRSKHQYSLEQFDLDESSVRRLFPRYFGEMEDADSADFPTGGQGAGKIAADTTKNEN